MSLTDRVAALVAVAPPDCTVTVAALAGWLAEDGAVAASPATAPEVDRTAEAAGELLGRAASTIRTWCATGELTGAYRLHGREWRIPMSAIVDMQRRQQQQAQMPRRTAPKEAGTSDLSAWRQHRKRSA